MINSAVALWRASLSSISTTCLAKRLRSNSSISETSIRPFSQPDRQLPEHHSKGSCFSGATGRGMNGDAEIVGGLKIDPEFECIAKVTRQAQRGIGIHERRPLTISAHSVDRDFQVARQRPVAENPPDALTEETLGVRQHRQFAHAAVVSVAFSLPSLPAANCALKWPHAMSGHISRHSDVVDK